MSETIDHGMSDEEMLRFLSEDSPDYAIRYSNEVINSSEG